MSVDRKGMLTSRCSLFLWGFLGLCPTMTFHEISAVELYRMVSSAPHAASNLELKQPEMFGKELYTPRCVKRYGAIQLQKTPDQGSS